MDTGPVALISGSVSEMLATGEDGFQAAVTARTLGPVPRGARILAPLDLQEIWAAGVTFRRSRDARREESREASVYDLVYSAERPELFMKALPGRCQGPAEPIAVRVDSTWDVPEPEIVVVATAKGRIVAYTLGNDVSSRSIEGENPLYLPQAKIYHHSCAIGPCLVPLSEAPALNEMEIHLAVHRDGIVVVEGTAKLSNIRRRPEDLVAWLFRAQEFPLGVALMTGTSLAPGPDFTLRRGDVVEISASGLGTLRNIVETTGTA
ncbi:MAG: fumarylacetoacetate hydrolase family protein [Candidatus Dormiibacterota bacterium]